MIFTSPLPEVELPPIAITPAVFRHAKDLADKTAVIDGPTGRSYTYGLLYDLTRRVAGGLAARGFGKGDVLAIMAPNLPEYAIAFHAAALLGGISTTINPTYTAEEVEYQLNDAGAKLMVTISPFLETAGEGAARSRVEEIFTFDPAEGATPFISLAAADPVNDQAPVDPETDVVVLPYSSGTTGLPKGVMLTHHNLVANLVQSQHAVVMGDDEVVIAVLPFFHIYGMQVLMNGVLHSGGTTVTLPRFDLEQFLQVIQEHQVTQAYVVPPIVLALAKHPLIDAYDLASLRRVFSGAAPLTADLAAEAAGRIGCEVVQGYGLTETSPVTHATPPGRFRAGSIGVAISNTEVRIVDPITGEDLGRNEDGELWIRGPQVMKGYLNKPQATAITIDDEGWLHTGDIGHVEDDGHYFIVDRLKELIKYKGFQVAPAELEGLLLTHPDVADAAVIPVPDLEAGELPKGFVVLKPGHSTSPESLMAFVAGHVAHYKQIRLLELVDEIPKSSSGKILRRVLRDRQQDRA
ncbi:MAG: 4-coumarate--CoA ligase family protein [Acidimicrobiia bacterium]|nr:4-coumarate--CoA ligase family protein [Acidimicrobiia bacterium]MDH3397174.1 4-coumarate--CoA ligase family protein [Acidimicrobiia bacterium]